MIGKDLKSLTDSQVSRLLKNHFSKREKHKYECNQSYNSTKDQHFKLSKSSLNKNFKHNDLKNTHTHTHTHTLNKSNKFYISKIS